MDNRQRLWSRISSKLRWGHRNGYSCAQSNSRTPRHKLWQLARCRSAPTTPLGVNVIHNSGPSRSSDNGIHFRFGGRLAERQESFIPKCLTGLNTHMLLSGQGCIENFSRNCWLENNLHRFGQLPETESSNPFTDIEIATVGDFSNNLVSQVRLATFQTVLRNNPLINSLLGESHFEQRTSSQTVSTISSNSNFPNLNLSGFAFDPDALTIEPPPYSEFPDDPPPSYEESTLVEYRGNRQQASNSDLFSNEHYLY